ncbi:MAG: hypothetical protein ACH37Z_07195 [Anaerolineae bacterium]
MNRLPRSRRLVALVAFLLTGCVPASPAAQPPPPTVAGPAGDAPPVEIAIASSDLAVGKERFAFALLDEAKDLLPDADLALTFFRIQGDKALQAAQAKAHYYASPLAGAGLYVAPVTFEQAGVWGLEVAGRLADGRTMATQRIRFTVAGHPAGPAVGETPPPTTNPVLAAGQDIREISTDPQPDPELYAMTVDQARASGRPTLVLMATPGLCQSKICQPVMGEVKALKARWQGKMNFIHVEVYRSMAEPGELSATMQAWGLSTEPWVYLLDKKGRVAARLEGSASVAELEPLLQALDP